jgi:hypothetical protein
MFQRKKFLDETALTSLLNDSNDDLSDLTVSEEDSDNEDGVIQEETIEVEDKDGGRVTLTPPPCTPPPLSPGSRDMFDEDLPSPSGAPPPAKRQRVLTVHPAPPVLSDNSGMILFCNFWYLWV